jgi:hypothetical protein
MVNHKDKEGVIRTNQAKREDIVMIVNAFTHKKYAFAEPGVEFKWSERIVPEGAKLPRAIDSLKEKVVLHEEIVDRFRRDTEFRNLIAGSSVLSLELIEKGTKGGRFLIPSYFGDSGHHVKMVLAHDLYKEVTGEEGVEVEDVLVNGITNWGLGYHWSAIELLREYRVNKKFIWGRESIMDYVYHFLNRIDSHKDKKFNAKTVVAEFRNGSIRQSLFSEIVGAFGNMGREGVLILYGDKDKFRQFVLKQRYELVDDQALSVYSDIPGDLVLAVCPLGAYEKEKMGIW